METTHSRARPLQTFKQTAEKNPAFSDGALRWLRFNGSRNGFNQCVVKVGRRVLIDPEKFQIWLDAQREIDA